MTKIKEIKEPEWKHNVRSAIQKFKDKELPLWHNKSNAEYIFKFLEKELDL